MTQEAPNQEPETPSPSSVTNSFADESSRCNDPCLIPEVISGLADANAWGNQKKDVLGSGEMRIRTPTLEFME